MFDTLKIYTRKEISLTETVSNLAQYGYSRVDDVAEEGDFSVKGDILEVFPASFNFPVRFEWDFGVIEKIYSFDKTIKKKLISYDFLIVIPYKKRKRKYSEDIPLDIVLRVKKGDYVVHTQYGIGKFLGMKKIKVKEQEEYFFTIEYAENSKLYVAKEEAHLIQKYINFTSRVPVLSKLGNKDWTRLKEKVQNGIRKFALELLRMEAQRKIIGGHEYSKDNDWQKQFEDLFPYKETDDQLKTTDDVKKDMETPGCMDRLVCGDTGYGKTEVAMRAAFKAVMSGKQVAFLVPTTILAYQHYKNLAERVKDFPVQVEMLSRFRTAAEQKNIIKGLAAGKVDIIVGTHRLLSKDVAFKDLGFLIVDEEQRFGVLAKERIKSMRVGIDVLMMTATPIPRTLYMGLIGLKEISLIRTPPKDRLGVKTEVVEFSQRVLKDVIIREFNRKGQVFFIHNRIETIHKIEKILKKILPEKIRIGLIHGRMSGKDIERIMLDFIEKRIDCLLSTAIVESGIDIPSANTIIVNDAHRFGLSDLHQLRGRVGRYIHQAYSYFMVPKLALVPTDAKKRLDLLEEFSHLGAGFEIAMSDLELRGAGNLLGTQQHGFVWMIGFDLYCRLLKKEIEYLRETFKLEMGT
jgi:transcription-repair coupling factor (superfamily II helicase)